MIPHLSHLKLIVGDTHLKVEVQVLLALYKHIIQNANDRVRFSSNLEQLSKNCNPDLPDFLIDHLAVSVGQLKIHLNMNLTVREVLNSTGFSYEDFELVKWIRKSYQDKGISINLPPLILANVLLNSDQILDRIAEHFKRELVYKLKWRVFYAVFKPDSMLSRLLSS